MQTDGLQRRNKPSWQVQQPPTGHGIPQVGHHCHPRVKKEQPSNLHMELKIKTC